jgi:two-component system response regulator CssR
VKSLKAKIYLLDDDKELNNILTTYLLKEGWEVKSFFTGEEAINAINERPHIWLLDIMLPDTDGFDVIKKIREKTPNVPVIFISARDQNLDRVLGLEMGSDDYIAKPFLPRELIIRVKKLFERVYGVNAESNGKLYIVSGYEIDTGRRKITDNGALVDLSSKEIELIIALLNNNGKPLTRDKLLNIVWGENYFGSDRVVDDTIRRLRAKLPNLKIETIYGLGYRIIF